MHGLPLLGIQWRVEHWSQSDRAGLESSLSHCVTFRRCLPVSEPQFSRLGMSNLPFSHGDYVSVSLRRSVRRAAGTWYALDKEARIFLHSFSKSIIQTDLVQDGWAPHQQNDFQIKTLEGAPVLTNHFFSFTIMVYFRILNALPVPHSRASLFIHPIRSSLRLLIPRGCLLKANAGLPAFHA